MFIREVIAAAIIRAVYETKGIFNLANRAYDAETQPGVDFVKIPILATLTVMTKADLVGNVGLGIKEDTNMMSVALAPLFIRLMSSVEARIIKNPLLYNEYVAESRRKLARQYNKLLLAKVDKTANGSLFKGDALSLDDFVEIKQFFDQKEIPEEGRVCVVDAGLQDQLWNIDIIQRAAAFDRNMLAKGVFVELLGFTFFVSALNPQRGGKKTIQSFYGPAAPVIIPSFTEEQGVYDKDTGNKFTDLITWHGNGVVGVDSAQGEDKFAFVKTQK